VTRRHQQTDPTVARARPWRTRGLVVLALLAAALIPAVSLARGPRPNIILVVIDTLRADHLGSYGYARPTSPRLDHFAGEAISFDSAFTVMPHTLPAHLSLFTSRYPRELGILMNGQTYDGAFPTLAELLKEAGYDTGAFVSGLPVQARFGLDQGFDTYVDATHFKPEGTIAAQAFDQWLDQREEGPFFSWVHLYDPHIPYAPPAEMEKVFREDDALRAWVLTHGIAAGPGWGRSIDKTVITQRPTPAGASPFLHNLNLYDAEILFADQVVGDLLQSLKDRKIYDDSIIIIMSDHGEGLGQHGYYLHGLHLYEEQLRLPLMIRMPGGAQGGSRVAGSVSLLDLLPTLADVLHLEGDDSWRGLSLRPALGGQDQEDLDGRLLFSESRQYPPRRELSPDHWTGVRRFSVRDGRWKLIRTTEGTMELFDLRADRGERADVHRENVSVTRRLTRALDDWLQRVPQGEPASGSSLSDEDRRRLRSLGYASDSP
jgi:arylsulfatase A-like enzyme